MRPLLVPLLLLLLLSAPSSAQEAGPPLRIGVSLDGTVDQQSRLLELFQQEISVLLQHDRPALFPAGKVVEGGSTLATARAANDRLLEDPEVDVVLGLGALVSVDLAQRRDLPKPAVAPFILDASAQGVPRDGRGASGVPNLYYVEPAYDFAHDLEVFARVVDFDEVAVLATPGLLEALPSGRAGPSAQGVAVDLVPMAGSVEATLRDLPEGADAAYLVYLTQLPGEDFERLVHGLHARGVPTFSLSGEIGVERGALVGLTPREWYPRLARRVGLNLRRIALGQEAGELPVRLTREDELYLNLSAARELGISPTFAILTEAVLEGELRREPERVLDLRDALQRALDENRELAAFRRQVEAGEKDVDVARSALLPQLRATLKGVIIDQDRAALGLFGAERTLSGGLELEQVLWSESAWAGLAVQGHLQRALRAELAARELDVALQAAQAYFRVLQAETSEGIERDNLRLTRGNLERARVRESLGEASPAEVYRWQSRIAADRDAVITSVAQRNVAELALHRALHLPLEAPLGLVEPDLDDPLMGYVDQRILPYVRDPVSLRRFRTFMVQRGLAASPELARLDAALAAQQRRLDSAHRSFWSPDLVFQGSLTRRLEESGAGSGPSPLPGFPLPDDTDWSLGLALRLPLFEGARRFAESGRAAADLRRLRRQREAVAEQVEERIRASIHVASASLSRIDLSREGAAAAARNLELVRDAYARGAVSIIDLLDAQTADRTARQNEANAVFRFLADVMAVERAVGAFTFLADEAEREAWLQDLRAWFDAAKEQP